MYNFAITNKLSVNILEAFSEATTNLDSEKITQKDILQNQSICGQIFLNFKLIEAKMKCSEGKQSLFSERVHSF